MKGGEERVDTFRWREGAWQSSEQELGGQGLEIGRERVLRHGSSFSRNPEAPWSLATVLLRSVLRMVSAELDAWG